MTYDVIIDGRPAKLTLNGSEFRYEREGVVVEGQASIIEVEPGIYSVLIGERSWEVKLAYGHAEASGRRMEIEVIDPRRRRPASSAKLGHGPQTIAAPMPGKVIRVLASEGESVEAGQGLVVVEAMKMQNEMKAPKAGRVVSLRAREGAAVGAGEPLAVIE